MKCPDCGAEITEVLVERSQTRTFKVDHEKKELTPVYPNIGWEDYGDFVYSCPNCDGSVDELLKQYELKEE